MKECRREWRRLRVPDAIANEMAADLEADLREAESEGASAEDVLGSGVFDARSFAASWAAERGVIPAPRSKRGLFGRSPLLAAIVALAMIAALGGGMVIASRVGAPGSVTLAAGPPFATGPLLQPCFRPFLPPADKVIPPCPPPWERIGRTIVGRPPLESVRAAFVRFPGSRLDTIGGILLTVGLIGIIVLMLIGWAFRQRWSIPATHVDDASDKSDWI
jgi:hypothetical protein